MDQVTVHQQVPRVLPGRHVGQHRGHLVLYVDAGGHIVGEEGEQHRDGVHLGHGGQDEGGEEGEVGKGRRAQQEGLGTLCISAHVCNRCGGG